MNNLIGGFHCQADVALLSNYKRKMFKDKKNNQVGTAIITALLFMVLVSAITIGIAFRQSLNLEQTQLIIDANQLWLAEKTMVAKAESELTDWLNSIKKQPNNLKKNYDRQGNFKPITLHQVINNIDFKTTILDAQSYFNINSLVPPQAANPQAANPQAANPQAATNTNPPITTLLYSRILNHFESKNTNNILNETIAYVSPRSSTLKSSGVHIPMSSITELRLLPSMTGKLYESFFNNTTPVYLFALPISSSKISNKINLNTVNSVLFHILLPDSQLDLTRRPFTDQELNTLKLTKEQSFFTLKSNFYLIKTKATSQEKEISTIMYSLIKVIDSSQSNNKQFQLIWFSQGTV